MNHLTKSGVNVFSKIKSFLHLPKNNPLSLASLHSTYYYSTSNNNSDDHLFNKVTNLNDALNVFDKMTLKTPLPSVEKFNKLLSVVNNMKHFSTSVEIFKRMCSLGVPVDYDTMNIVVEEGKFVEAERLFEKVTDKGVCEGNVTMYNTVIKGFCELGGKNNPLSLASLHSTYYYSTSNNNSDDHLFNKVTNLNDALNVFDKMTLKTPLPSVEKFNKLLSVVNNMKHFSTSVEIFKRMCSLGVPVDYDTMNIVVKSCCEMCCMNEGGFVVLGCCIKRGVVPDVFTFGRMLNGLVREGKFVEAERLFEKVIDKGVCEANVSMYNTVIKALCKLGGKENVTKAVGLIRLMDERGCKPNHVGYSTIVDGLCKEELIDEALEIFMEMVNKQGISPNVVTYNSLIDGFCKSGRWDEASKMLKEMMNEGVSPDLQTFNILVNEYCKKDKVEKAEEVLCIMQERGISPNTVTFNSLLDCYCKRGDLTNAKRILDSMGKSGCQPSNATCNVLLQGYLKNKQYDDAEMLLKEMDGSCYSIDVSTLTLLSDLVAAGCLDTTMLKLIGKLAPKEEMDSPCVSAQTVVCERN
ncbi:tetratricopeptide-like helical domain-containing protein [Artemisia annua]|uniref:Tetratricopeptide-like helical domain-containing protein n=1 Tax=Artemisia annua TaxID=35608 RepID=A0A2U1MCL9_ARTAN|nr:tetratricopeptide-like helical domain-containing protein [Artemisia annua]